MPLPVPTADEVERFKDLYQRLFNVKLTDEEARDTATRLVHIYFIKHYAIHPLCQEK